MPQKTTRVLSCAASWQLGLALKAFQGWPQWTSEQSWVPSCSCRPAQCLECGSYLLLSENTRLQAKLLPLGSTGQREDERATGCLKVYFPLPSIALRSENIPCHRRVPNPLLHGKGKAKVWPFIIGDGLNVRPLKLGHSQGSTARGWGQPCGVFPSISPKCWKSSVESWESLGFLFILKFLKLVPQFQNQSWWLHELEASPLTRWLNLSRFIS